MCPSSSFLFFHPALPFLCLSACRCRMCAATFLSKSDMQIHSKSHTEAKPHKCPHCAKSFANSSYLAQHIRIHSGAKPYTCSYCQKSFRQLSHLQQHTRYCRPPFPCNQSHTIFPCPVNLFCQELFRSPDSCLHLPPGEEIGEVCRCIFHCRVDVGSHATRSIQDWPFQKKNQNSNYTF